MAETITVRGLQDTQKALYTFSQRLGDRVVLGALRQGANLVRKAAQEKAPIKDGKLKRGIVVRLSKIHRGKRSTDLIGVYITVASKKKTDPYYGRFQEDGWNTRGKRKGVVRRAIVEAFGSRSGRKTLPGKTNVPGKKFIDSAFQENREKAVEVIAHAAREASGIVAKKLGLKYGG